MRSAMGFLMTTESQDLGLTSNPKDGESKVIYDFDWWREQNIKLWLCGLFWYGREQALYN